MPRPEYTPELAAEICERIANGQSLREIGRDEAMPAKSTVMKWLSLHTEFVDQYARAREAQADHFAEEILEISDDGSNDWMERKNADGSTGDTVADHEHISRSKLRVDSRKWLMSKLAPKKYGDKLELDNKHSVSDPLAEILNRVAEHGRRIHGDDQS